MIIFEPRDDYPELISDLNYRDTLYNYVTGEKIGEYLGYTPEDDELHLYKITTLKADCEFNMQGIDRRYSYHHFGEAVENGYDLKFIITSIRITNKKRL